ncbi:hypothetical protein [Rhodanobacter koreensis]
MSQQRHVVKAKLPEALKSRAITDMDLGIFPDANTGISLLIEQAIDAINAPSPWQPGMSARELLRIG